MHWTYDAVLGLDAEVYDELLAWVNETESAQAGSVDMDAVMDAKRAKGSGDG